MLTTPNNTRITILAICASAFFACVRTLPADAIDDAPVPEVSDTEPAETDDSTDTEADPVPDFPDAEWGWEPEPDMPEDDVCACSPPATIGDGDGDPDGDPAGDGDGDHYCGCGIIGAEDSFCYSPDGCKYFLGGCPDGWAEICDP